MRQHAACQQAGCAVRVPRTHRVRSTGGKDLPALRVCVLQGVFFVDSAHAQQYTHKPFQILRLCMRAKLTLYLHNTPQVATCENVLPISSPGKKFKCPAGTQYNPQAGLKTGPTPGVCCVVRVCELVELKSTCSNSSSSSRAER